ncbi:MAG TPA: TlpA disulfide reductase family protein [Ramlibacter sp.]|nr:TlpA disulfide reductase family protein [Ramlibacter sp.]
MKRRAALAGALAACVAGCSPAPDAQARPRWPALPVREFTGQARTLAAASGQPQVINMWALWCPPCRAELPALERLAAALGPQGIAVTAIALADDLFAVREYLARYAARLPGAVLSPGLPVVRELGLDALPQTFFIAPDGGVLACWVGARDWDAAPVRGELAKVLKGA